MAVGPVTDATSAVVIRVWREHGLTELRGRITVLGDDPDADDIVTVTSGAGAILAVVRAWLEAFQRGKGLERDI